MFTYCGNNPIVVLDPTGYCFRSVFNHKNAIYLKAEGERGTALQQIQSEAGNYRAINGTVAAGFTGTIASGAGATGSIGVTGDWRGNVGGILSVGEILSVPTAPSYSRGFFVTFTNADDVYRQEGYASVEGGSINLFGINLGIDHSFFENADTGEIYQGITFVFSFESPSPPEAHTGFSYSYVNALNIFDIWKK